MSWSPMTSLPGVRYGVRGITVGTQVLMMGNIRFVHTIITSSLQYSGGSDGYYSYKTGRKRWKEIDGDEIYSLDLNTEKWKLVDNLNVARKHQAVSSVELNLFDFCN